LKRSPKGGGGVKPKILFLPLTPASRPRINQNGKSCACAGIGRRNAVLRTTKGKNTQQRRLSPSVSR